MKIIDCECCGKIIRIGKNDNLCKFCGEKALSIFDKPYIFENDDFIDIDPNPYGKCYKTNPKCCEEYKKIVEEMKKENGK